ncbi:MAG: helix-turn-helix domain-containing protein [Oscillospiraceae bacterium]|nr:helix-turn-helix domain-containing protein [Oscillospiraceae bacterium]
MNLSIGNTLAELRRAKNHTQKEVASRLSGYGFSVNAKTIYNWEKELSQPNIPYFLALCDILGVDDALWRFAGIHKGPYAGLNQAGRQKARELIDLLFQIDKYRDDPKESDDPPRLLRLYDIPVSAGSGIFLDDSGYEMIEAPEYVPASADFALRVSGDSMEPLFQDGQVIWIKEQETLGGGEIGIFIYFDDVYLKKLVVESGKAYLRSLNPKYSDIEIKEDFGFKAIGKIVS